MNDNENENLEFNEEEFDDVQNIEPDYSFLDEEDMIDDMNNEASDNSDAYSALESNTYQNVQPELQPTNINLNNNSRFFRDQKPENQANQKNQNAISRLKNRKANTLGKKADTKDPVSTNDNNENSEQNNDENKTQSNNPIDKAKDLAESGTDKLKQGAKETAKKTGKAVGEATKKAGSAAVKGIVALATNPATAPFFWGAVLILILIIMVPVFIAIFSGGGSAGSSSNGEGLSCSYNVSGQDYSDVKVRLLQCGDGDRGQPISGEELVDFEKYILGVVYAENGSKENASKAQAIAARSYVLTRGQVMNGAFNLGIKEENGQAILQIRNCTEDQVYCDPDKGCWSNNPGANETVHTGVDSSKSYSKGPLSEDSELRQWVEETKGITLNKTDGSILYTPFMASHNSSCVCGKCMSQNEANELDSQGNDYNQILMHEYGSGNAGIDTSKSCTSNGGIATFDGEFIWPTDSGHITSTFGGPRDCLGCTTWHDAIDVRAAQGVAIYSIADGEVVYAGGGYHTLTIYHGIYNGKKLFSRYQHGDILVKVGDTIKKGQKIATSNGWSPRGNIYTPHLDYTVIELENDVDNQQWDKGVRYNPLISIYKLDYSKWNNINPNIIDVSIEKADGSILTQIDYDETIKALLKTSYCNTWDGPCG